MKALFLLAALSLAFISCSDEPSDDPAKTKALTTGTWKLTDAKTDYQKDGVYEEDTYSMYEACAKDNLYTFEADGKLIWDEGATKCFDNNPQTGETTWSFADHQKKLNWGGDEHQVELITQSTLILRRTTYYNAIYTINIKSTYTKQ